MEFKIKVLASMIGLASMAFLSGCATGGYEKVPSASAGTAQTLDQGTVIATRNVKIDGEATNLGRYGGGIMGSAVGSTVGRGDGRVLASAGGAVAGAIVGQQVEKALTTKLAQEVTIELDDGRTVVVVQELQEPEFKAGDRVSLLESRGGDARVRHEDFTAAF